MPLFSLLLLTYIRKLFLKSKALFVFPIDLIMETGNNE